MLLNRSERGFLKLTRTFVYGAQFADGVVKRDLYLIFLSQKKYGRFREYAIEYAWVGQFRGLEEGKFYTWEELGL